MEFEQDGRTRTSPTSCTAKEIDNYVEGNQVDYSTIDQMIYESEAGVTIWSNWHGLTGMLLSMFGAIQFDEWGRKIGAFVRLKLDSSVFA